MPEMKLYMIDENGCNKYTWNRVIIMTLSKQILLYIVNFRIYEINVLRNGVWMTNEVLQNKNKINKWITKYC